MVQTAAFVWEKYREWYAKSITGSVIKIRISSIVVAIVNGEEDSDGDNDDVPKPSTGLTKHFGGLSHLVLYTWCPWEA